jgi:hypothetical protein
MLLRRATIVLVIASVAALRAQNKSAIDQWIQQHFEAATIYRAGDTPNALALLNTMTLDEQEKAVRAIREQMERIVSGFPPRRADVIPWTPRSLRALGSLQMEATVAARASTNRDRFRTAGAHIALAETLFAVVTLLTKEEARSAARWRLAMGLEPMAEGKFSLAYAILVPACAEHEDYAPLLVACGSLHETYASSPADDRLALEEDARPVRDMTRSHAMSGLHLARAARSDWLNSARKYLERAIAIDGRDSEAPLRLANIRMRQGADQEAAQILEGLLARPSLDARKSYLAGLFLSRVRDHQNRLGDAAAALTKTPPAQSALIARAHNEVRRGNARDAAILAGQAALSTLDDPWWGYRFGQFWLPLELYKELRDEARQ